MIGDMYGDFSRMTFAPEKHFSAVLLQQGRVMLDSDLNEHTAVLLHHLRRTAGDLIGPYGGPAGAAAFAIGTVDGQPPDLTISPGRYYVNGLLCEVEDDTNYWDQPYAFLDRNVDSDRLPAVPYLVYLKVWERHVTAIQDPATREPALVNGPDTTVRSQIVWEVLASEDWPPESGKVVPADKNQARDHWQAWEKDQADAPTPKLTARARQPSADELDPCIGSPHARYRGLENQLYRVEIHNGGTKDEATFKWSRNNGSAVFPLDSLEGDDATVTSIGRDRRSMLEVGDWVEILDDRSRLRGDRPVLRQVNHVDPSDRLVVLESAAAGADVHGDEPDSSLHPFLRRWDQKDAPQSAGYAQFDSTTGLLKVAEDTPLELEKGIQITFTPGMTYSPGDYWLIPARTATGDVIWPEDPTSPASGPEPLALPPMGIHYYYAPLALLTPAGTHDLRWEFNAISSPVEP